MKPGFFRSLFSPKRRFHVCVGFPTLLALLYLLFFAASTYRTETRLIVRESSEETTNIIPGLAANLLGGGIKSSIEDAYILVDYLQSSALIEQVDAQLDLRAHYSAPRLDFIRRLASDAPAETLHDYYRRHVTISVAPESSIVTLQVDAFDPVFTQKFAQSLVTASEQAINQLNSRMVGAQTALAEKELARTRAELTAARRRLLDFQVAHNIVDPAGEIGSRLGSLAVLDERLVEKRAELRTKEQFLREDAFELRTLRQEITALEAQRNQENQRLINPDNHGMTVAAAAYEEVKLGAEFALHAYTAALALDEKAKLSAARQEKFLLPIAVPLQPEEPVFPAPFVGTLTAFILFSLLYGIIRLIIATIRDHTL
ncbi:MAG: capsular biosynthesis protein [Rariglobus sp.]|jgi:capsular polysaccharide transport system permease protein|nr:capsular biosynthesis protein [Rariglobus sp.]